MSDDIGFSIHGLNADNSVKLGDDSKMAVQFYKRAVPDEFRSKQAGTSLFVQKDYVKIFQPGERDFIDRPVKESDKYRFPRHWQAYQAGLEKQAEDGTPLDHLFPGNPEIVAMLAAVHVHTVQHLANLTDSSAGNFQFGGDLRKKAQTFLEGAEKGKTFHALEEQVSTLIAQNKLLVERITALEAEGDDEGETPRRGPGRPRKHQPEILNNGPSY